MQSNKHSKEKLPEAICPNKEMQLVTEHMDKRSALFTVVKYVYSWKKNEMRFNPL